VTNLLMNAKYMSGSTQLTWY